MSAYKRPGAGPAPCCPRPVSLSFEQVCSGMLRAGNSGSVRYIERTAPAEKFEDYRLQEGWDIDLPSLYAQHKEFHVRRWCRFEECSCISPAGIKASLKRWRLKARKRLRGRSRLFARRWATGKAFDSWKFCDRCLGNGRLIFEFLAPCWVTEEREANLYRIVGERPVRQQPKGIFSDRIRKTYEKWLRTYERDRVADRLMSKFNRHEAEARERWFAWWMKHRGGEEVTSG